MKILESQNAVLTNFEVYQFLTERNERLGRQKHNRRRDADTLVKEVMQYFRLPRSPLSQEPITYSAEAVTLLVQRLRGYDLAKGEVVMILNIRPHELAHLHACIEELEERLTEAQQYEILDIVAEVLGQFPLPDETEEAGQGEEAMDSEDLHAIQSVETS